MGQLRPFRWGDLEPVLEVRNRSAGVGAGQPPATRAAFEAYWRKGEAQAERDIWVAVEGAEVRAYGALRPWGRAGWLGVEVVVDPEARRRGLGRALLERLVAEARARGTLTLAATAPDRPAEPGEFLRRQGFRLELARQHMRLQPIRVPDARAVPGCRLRPASQDESTALAALTNLAYGPGSTDEATYRRYLQDSGARVWAAERSGGAELLGLCEAHGRETALDGRVLISGHIASLAVHPKERRQGLGRWLLAAGIGYCLETGWPTVELNVDCDNLPARRLYESVGFTRSYGYAVYRRDLGSAPRP